MNMARLSTLRELSRKIDNILSHDPFPDHLLGDFIDDFRLRAKSREEKMGMVQDEPESLGWDRHPDVRAYLAAVSEALCREAGLPPPTGLKSRIISSRNPGLRDTWKTSRPFSWLKVRFLFEDGTFSSRLTPYRGSKRQVFPHQDRKMRAGGKGFLIEIRFYGSLILECAVVTAL